MKPVTVLLAASLGANAALVAFLALRPSASPSKVTSSAPAASSKATGSSDPAALRAALESGDAAALAAAGFSPETVRELLAGRAMLRAADRIRAARAAQPADPRWWRLNRGGQYGRDLAAQNRRELSDALAAIGLEDLAHFPGTSPSDNLAFLSADKRDALRRIVQDYDEMMAKFSAGGLQLASDRERLKLLRAERERDIAALLSPAEREEYEMRTSQTAQNVRARYGDGIETEDDFRKIYALQKAFDDKYPMDAMTGRVSPDSMRQRSDAQRQLQDDIRAALGDEKFAAMRRATDSDLRTVESLVSRLNLPPATTDQIATARETFAAESQRINGNTALSPQERRTQIQDLGNRARMQLTQSLGAEAADAYAQRSPWVSMLQNGMAYSTTPPAGAPGIFVGSGPSVHPVMPAGAAGAAPRQTFTIATPVVGEVENLVGPAGAPGGMRVMTFTTSDTSTTGAAAGGDNTQRVIVTPKPDPANTPVQPKR